MKITKEQIRELYNCSGNGNKLKEWFPKAFETKLEAGKWYKDTTSNALIYVSDIRLNLIGYGFGISGNWSNSTEFFSREKDRKLLRLATDKEVEDTLIAEAKKRGFREGVYIKTVKGTIKETYARFEYDSFHGLRSMNDSDGYNSFLFKDGQWAEIIPTMTIKEAEAKLNVKIV